MYLGIDLSCYTTSCAVADGEGKIVYDERRLLEVGEGKRGLKQSEMVFMHIKNLKELFPAGFLGVKAVAVSAKPRPVEGSYMPVFAAAESYASVVAKALDVPLYKLTHQHGHIGAAIIGNEQRLINKREVIALHVSGGTTDVLLAKLDGLKIQSIEQLGSTSDISAGMLLDRLGVRLGLPFPAGPSLERIAKQGGITISSSVKGLCVSFSGAEAQALRLIDEGADAGELAYAAFRCVANALEKLIRRACEATGINTVLLFGGVMANSFIRQRLSKRLACELIFADKRYSSDNSCGLASQCRLINIGESKDA